MLGSCFGFAAAATYPAPFVEGGTAAGAVVYGSNAAVTDATAAINLADDLETGVTSATSARGGSITGEAAPIFTSGTKLYINDTFNTVKSALTKSDLPTILKDGSFSGNVDATFTQTITLGPNAQVVFAKIPTSSDDPTFGLAFSTTTSRILYNASVTFNKNVNLANSESEGEDITMFGQKFTIAAASDVDTLVLLKEAEKLSLDSESNPSQEVTVGGETYTVELVSASDTAATIRVTDSSGASDSKEINEAASKKIQGLTVAVQTADETNLKLSASVIAGAEKVTLENTANVKIGEDDTIVDGTRIVFSGADTNLTKITIEVFAPNSDEDAIKPGASFTDPVFGSFKVDFAGINSPEGSTSREDIVIQNSGDDKMTVKFRPYSATEAKAIQFAKNLSTGINMEYTDGKNITVAEGQAIQKGEYVVVGNEDEGYLLKVTTISNQSGGTTYSSDKVEFQDVFTGTVYSSTITSKLNGEVNIGGKVYTLKYEGTSSDEANSIIMNYPDSSTTGNIVVYPTIETSKGANLAFYEPLNITLDNMDLLNEDLNGTDVTGLRFPDGDGYTDVAITLVTGTEGNYTVGGTLINSSKRSVTADIGKLTYNITYGGFNRTVIYLLAPEGGNIVDPAIVIFEEKDDNTEYHAIIVDLEAGATSDDGIGVNDVRRTWGVDGSMQPVSGVSDWDAEVTLQSDTKKQKEADLWGVVALVDKSDSDQNSATISYPDEQVAAEVYIAEVAAAITAAEAVSGAGGQILAVTDSEVNSVKDLNLIVVGGSCINTVAATMLESETPVCGAAFSDLTTVGAGQYLIKVIASPYNADKIAMLVAGYNAEDTEAAVATVKEGVATDVGTSTVYPLASA